MPDLLWLKWTKSLEGHRIEEFDPRKIDWTPDPDNDYSIRPPRDANAATIRLLEKWGMRLQPAVELVTESDDGWLAASPQPFLIVDRVGESVSEYYPLEGEGCLFQEFADTAKTPEGIKRFADRYGLLLAYERGPETVDFWYRQIDRMRIAVKAWQKGRNKDLTSFVKRFSFHLVIGNTDHYFDESDMLVPASVFLAQTEDPTRPRLRVKPQDLLAAMWLELALAVEGNLNYRRCEVCPTWFEVAPGTGRGDKRYCSDACRMRAYRKRKAAL